MDNIHDYSDIIDLEYPRALRHPQMSMHDRAAQFAPFAALTGYEDALAETARRTDARPELSEEMLDEISARIRRIQACISERPQVLVTYFVPDPRKDGGAVITEQVRILSIHEQRRLLMLADGREILIDDVLELEMI